MRVSLLVSPSGLVFVPGITSGETRVSEVSGGLSAGGQSGDTDHRPMYLVACYWGVVEGVFVSCLNLVYISVCV